MGKRDACADLVDDDPFRTTARSPPNSSSSSASSTDGTVQYFETLLCVFERHASIPGQDNWEKPNITRGTSLALQ